MKDLILKTQILNCDMNMKLRKTKEKIRSQVLKSLSSYVSTKGISFFDNEVILSNNRNITLEKDEIEVLEISLQGLNWLLITIKYLYIFQNDSFLKIEINTIESYQFINSTYPLNAQKASEFEKLSDYKKWIVTGNFNIQVINKPSVTLFIPNHDFSFCLINALKKLQFTNKKYQSI